MVLLTDCEPPRSIVNLSLPSLFIELSDLFSGALLDRFNQLWIKRLDRMKVRIGLHQAGIDVNFAPFDQAGFYALLHHSAKERNKYFFAPALARLAQDTVIRNLIIQSIAKEPR